MNNLYVVEIDEIDIGKGKLNLKKKNTVKKKIESTFTKTRKKKEDLNAEMFCPFFFLLLKNISLLFCRFLCVYFNHLFFFLTPLQYKKLAVDGRFLKFFFIE